MTAPARLGDEDLLLAVSLIPYLHSRGEPDPERPWLETTPVRLDEVAARFGVEPERILRVMHLMADLTDPIENANLPRQSELGYEWDWPDEENGHMIALQRSIGLRRVPSLSARERAALIAGLQQLAALPGFVDPEAAQALAAKLGASRQLVPLSEDALRAEAEELARAIAEGRRVRFTYRAAASGTAVRTVDPQRLDAVDGDRYLRGWDLDREAHRAFRLDRMRELEVLEEAAADHPDPPAELFAPGEGDVEVTLRILDEALPELEGYAPGRPTKADAAGWRTVRLRLASWDPLVRLACANAGRIEVLAPDVARAAVAAWARGELPGSAASKTSASSTDSAPSTPSADDPAVGAPGA